MTGADLRALLLVDPGHDVVLAVLPDTPADFAEDAARRAAEPFLR